MWNIIVYMVKWTRDVPILHEFQGFLWTGTGSAKHMLEGCREKMKCVCLCG